jgi:hypothetical protein
MNSVTSAKLGTTFAWEEVGNPHAASRAYQSDCAATGGPPCTMPTPCTTICRWRAAVIRGSFCRSEPEAVLRGLA